MGDGEIPLGKEEDECGRTLLLMSAPYRCGGKMFSIERVGVDSQRDGEIECSE